MRRDTGSVCVAGIAGMAAVKKPQFIYLNRAIVSNSDLRYLLTEMVERGVSDETAKLLGDLARTTPIQRLVKSFTKTLVNMSDHQIQTILDDGLFPGETAALVELDENHFSLRSRRTAHRLLCVKERWHLSQSIKGFFNRNRGKSDGFLDVEG